MTAADPRWWRRWPGRYAYEMRALRRLGLSVRLDRAAYRAGVIRWDVAGTVGGVRRRLRVTFPDLYPFARCEVEAPDDVLPYHQHPASRHLCILGRATANWNPGMTAAWAVAEQVPRVFEAATGAHPAAAPGLEEAQGEPFSDYYPYAPATLIVESRWAVPADEASGAFTVATLETPAPNAPPFVRGVVESIRGRGGRTLCRCDGALLRACDGPRLTGRWVRLDAPLAEFDAGRFVEALRRTRPADAAANVAGFFAGGRLELWGVTFPEEVRYGERRDGWAFACRYDRLADDPFAGLGPDAAGARSTFGGNLLERSVPEWARPRR